MLLWYIFTRKTNYDCTNTSFELCGLAIQTMIFTFCLCSFGFLKGKLRCFASEICQQRFLNSEWTCPMCFLFLPLSLASSSPFSITLLISVCPQMRQFPFPTSPSQFPTSLGPAVPSSSSFFSSSLTNLYSWLTTCALTGSIYTYIFSGSSPVFIWITPLPPPSPPECSHWLPRRVRVPGAISAIPHGRPS